MHLAISDAAVLLFLWMTLHVNHCRVSALPHAVMATPPACPSPSSAQARSGDSIPSTVPTAVLSLNIQQRVPRAAAGLPPPWGRQWLLRASY